MATQVASLFGRLSLRDDMTPALNRASGNARRQGRVIRNALLGVGGAVVALGSASVKFSVDFERSWLQVRKNLTGTDDELNAVRRTLLDMAKSRQNPLSSLENAQNTIAGIAADAAQLGIATENVIDFTQVLGEMRLAAESLGETAAQDFAQIIGITKTAASEYRNLGSAVAALGNNTRTNERAIFNYMLRIGSASTLARIGTADQLGYAAAMASTGIQAEAGGTAFTRFLNALGVAVGEGGQALSGFAQVAKMDARAFAQAWENNPTTAINNFLEGLGQLDQAGQIAALADLGLDGERLQLVLRNLAGDMELVNDALRIANTGWQENIALSEEAGTAASGAGAKWQQLKNRLRGALISDTTMDLTHSFLDGLANALDHIEGLLPAILPDLREMADILGIKNRDQRPPIEDTFAQMRERELVDMETRIRQIREMSQEGEPTFLHKVHMALGDASIASRQLVILTGIAIDRMNQGLQPMFEFFRIGFENTKTFARDFWTLLTALVERGKHELLVFANNFITVFGRIKAFVTPILEDIARDIRTAINTANVLRNSVESISKSPRETAGTVSNVLGSITNAALDQVRRRKVVAPSSAVSRALQFNGFLPARDRGGRGAAGQPVMIGKGAQPELFIPDSAGTYIPNADQLGNTYRYEFGGIAIHANSVEEGRAAAHGFVDELSAIVDRVHSNGMSLGAITN